MPTQSRHGPSSWQRGEIASAETRPETLSALVVSVVSGPRLVQIDDAGCAGAKRGALKRPVFLRRRLADQRTAGLARKRLLVGEQVVVAERRELVGLRRAGRAWSSRWLGDQRAGGKQHRHEERAHGIIGGCPYLTTTLWNQMRARAVGVVGFVLAAVLLAFGLTGTGLGTAEPAAAQATGRLVFIGTYTGPASQGIYAFRFDERTGRADATGAGGSDAESELPGDQSGPALPLCRQRDVVVRRRTIGQRAFVRDRPRHRQADRTERAVERAAPTRATSRSIGPGGSSSSRTTAAATSRCCRSMPTASWVRRRVVLGNEGSGPNKARQDRPHAHAVVFDPSQRFVLGADLGIDRVARLPLRRHRRARSAAHTPAAAATAPGRRPATCRLPSRRAAALFRQ